MITDHIDKIETKVQAAKGIPDDTRNELMRLLSTLKTEIHELSRTHGEDAASITRFTEVSAHEATREEKKPELVKVAVQGLSSSVDGFESSHPALVQIVNRIATILSNMGI